MGQDNSTPSSEGSQYIRFYNLLHFCDEHDSDIEKIREISHYKETNQPGELEVDNLRGEDLL